MPARQLLKRQKQRKGKGIVNILIAWVLFSVNSGQIANHFEFKRSEKITDLRDEGPWPVKSTQVKICIRSDHGKSQGATAGRQRNTRAFFKQTCPWGVGCVLSKHPQCLEKLGKHPFYSSFLSQKFYSRPHYLLSICLLRWLMVTRVLLFLFFFFFTCVGPTTRTREVAWVLRVVGPGRRWCLTKSLIFCWSVSCRI